MSLAIESGSYVRKHLPQVGQLVEGGYYAGLHQVGDRWYGVLVSPKKEGQIYVRLSDYNQATKTSAKYQEMFGENLSAGAESNFHGRTDTDKLLAVRNSLAIQVCSMIIGGYSDWHIPSALEVDVCYQACMSDTPNEFNAIGLDTNSFDKSWYLSSTEKSPGQFATRNFAFGAVLDSGELDRFYVRAVRWIDLTHLAGS